MRTVKNINLFMFGKYIFSYYHTVLLSLQIKGGFVQPKRNQSEETACSDFFSFLDFFSLWKRYQRLFFSPLSKRVTKVSHKAF